MSALRQRKGAASSKRQPAEPPQGDASRPAAAAAAAPATSRSEKRKAAAAAAAAELSNRDSLPSPAPVPAAASGCRTLLWSCLLVAQTALAIALLRPSAIHPVAYTLPRPPAFDGVLQANEALAHAERLFDGRLVGAESLAVHDGRDGRRRIYTGTADGRIVRLDLDGSAGGGSVSEFVRLKRSERCAATTSASGFQDEHACGRPLGLRIKGNTLYAVDAYSGVYRVDLEADRPVPELLVGGNVTFGNDLDVAANGTIYFTDSSRRWPRSRYAEAALEGAADGRLLSYDVAGGVRVLLDGIAFANGVQLSPKEDQVLVVETTRCRVLRLHLRGPMRGLQDVFASNLPGVPDNVRSSPRGTYWVGFATVRQSGKPSLFDLMAARPWVRYVLSALMPSGSLSHWMLPKYGLVVELDSEGHVVRSLHDPAAAAVPTVSEALELDDGSLYLGSYGLPYVSRVQLEP